MIFTCPEASCSLSYTGVNLDRLQRYGNLSIYIRISRSSSVHWQKPLPFVPVLHMWLSTTMPRDHQCTLEEEVAAESWRNITFIPHQNSPAIFIPGRLSQLPVLRSQPLSLLGWANGVLCSTELHVAAIAQGPAHRGRGRTGDNRRNLWGCCSLWRW